MGTRSNVAYEKEDGTIVATYCHYDGYLEYNGVMLLKYYNGEKQARDLVDNGYMSSLCSTIEEINEGRVHKEKPTTYPNEFVFMDSLDALFIEYVYLFKNGQWYVADSHRLDTPNGYREGAYYHSAFVPLLEVVTIDMMKEIA